MSSECWGQDNYTLLVGNKTSTRHRCGSSADKNFIPPRNANAVTSKIPYICTAKCAISVRLRHAVIEAATAGLQHQMPMSHAVQRVGPNMHIIGIGANKICFT
jgi:hypothetical protein